MSLIIGIDLGTTNSLVSVWRDNRACLIPNVLGNVLTPSCVSLDGDDSVLIGLPAFDRLHTHPEHSIANFKRYMGTPRQLRIGNTLSFRPEDLSSLVLKSLKSDAEAYLGEEVRDAVIAVPAYFSDAQRKATCAAGELAGLNVLRLINEPTAAALAYGVHNREGERKFLIFDLGGGTFDVSVLDFFEGVMEVRASTGDNFLGGQDFTDALVKAFCRHHQIDLDTLSSMDAQRLQQQAERAKRALSDSMTERITMKLAIGQNNYAYELDAAQIEHIFDPLLQRLRQPVERALRDARIDLDTLDEIILVGGASRMPIVRKLVSKMFGRLPSSHINPDEVVALGTAVQAGLLARDTDLRELVLTDVAPYSLGIETSIRIGEGQFDDGHYLPIIERNTIIPVSRVRRVVTTRDFQRSLIIKVFQGESRLTRDNIQLGSILLGIPPRPVGEAGVDVRFTYDVSGVLEVEATTFPNGETRSIVIEENPGMLSNEDIQRKLEALAALKIHPRDQMENRALLARADRIFEELLGDARLYLSQHVARFQAYLEKQDPIEITEARRALSAVLDQFDNQFVW